MDVHNHAVAAHYHTTPFFSLPPGAMELSASDESVCQSDDMPLRWFVLRSCAAQHHTTTQQYYGDSRSLSVFSEKKTSGRSHSPQHASVWCFLCDNKDALI